MSNDVRFSNKCIFCNNPMYEDSGPFYNEYYCCNRICEDRKLSCYKEIDIDDIFLRLRLTNSGGDYYLELSLTDNKLSIIKYGNTPTGFKTILKFNKDIAIEDSGWFDKDKILKLFNNIDILANYQ